MEIGVNKEYEPFCPGAALIASGRKGGATMTQTEKPKVTAMDLYRGFILGLVGVFYGFLIFLMFV